MAAPNQGSRSYSYGFEPGDRVQDLTFLDVRGKRGTLRQLSGSRGLVLFTRDVECPVSQRYLPRIRELVRDPKFKEYNFVVLDITPHELAQARKAALPGVRTIYDEQKRIATALNVQTAAEAIVIDSKGTLRYRGAIDDQYGITHQKARVGMPWLKSALARVARGEEPHERRTDAPGCAVATAAQPAVVQLPVTYHNRISRIVQDKCQVCHRVGGLGPMPLESFRQVFERRAVIAAMVQAGRMPPWSADPKIGHWKNDRSLGARQKADLLQWISQGAPEGDSRDAPQQRLFSRDWKIGKPDAVIPIAEPIRVPAQGVIEYKYVYVKTNFEKDMWVSAVEIRPTQPKVVHHVIALIEEPGRKGLSPQERARLKPGAAIPPQPEDTALGFFAITVPGSLGIFYPEGTGKRLPKGAWLKFEIHYQPNGQEVLDRTEIGFRFSGTPLKEVESLSALNTKFTIPPHDPKYQVKATYRFDRAGQLLSLFPHMHLRGTAFRYDLRYPDGRSVALLDVPRFDFNWQSYFEFQKPVEVPKGATLIATAWYDNSRNNSWNPDPSKTVRWGPQTYEEMMIGYFDFVADGSH